MPRENTHHASGNKPIPVGRLVSVAVSGRKSKYRGKTTPANPRPPRRNVNPQIFAIGAVGTLFVLAIVGIFLARAFHSDAPNTETPPGAEQVGQTANDVVASSERMPEAPRIHYADELVVVPTPPQGPAAQVPAPMHSETLAVAPRQVVRDVEVARITPPRADTRPTLPQAPDLLVRNEAPVKSATPVAVAKRPLPAVKEPSPVAKIPPSELRPPAIALKEPSKDADTQCGQFGTKINFLPSPTTAYEDAKKNTDKLVMVLNIAGNFEEKGFT